MSSLGAGLVRAAAARNGLGDVGGSASVCAAMRKTNRFLYAKSRCPSTAELATRFLTIPAAAADQDRRNRLVDLRSDTVTAPSPAMLQTAQHAPTGDDVLGEDPTVIALEEYVADVLGKPAGLFVPTCTMANLLAILAHCHVRASEIIVGASSHVSLWEGGNAASVGGVYSRHLVEDEQTAEMNLTALRDAFRDDTDVHCAETRLVCLETTHNMLGGVAVSTDYVRAVSALCHEHSMAVHVDGARLWNAAHAFSTTTETTTATLASVAPLVDSTDSVSVCLSKGLGAPLGSVLVGDRDLIHLARRARKRSGGGMRQAGVVAAMGLYAVQHNFHRLADDHDRAQRLARRLADHGFVLSRRGQVDTNMFFFGLPTNSKVAKNEFIARLGAEYGVKLTGGYSRGGELFRAVTHLDVTDLDIEHAAESMIQLCCA
jgi:threonine aldolase